MSLIMIPGVGGILSLVVNIVVIAIVSIMLLLLASYIGLRIIELNKKREYRKNQQESEKNSEKTSEQQKKNDALKKQGEESKALQASQDEKENRAKELIKINKNQEKAKLADIMNLVKEGSITLEMLEKLNLKLALIYNKNALFEKLKFTAEEIKIYNDLESRLKEKSSLIDAKFIEFNKATNTEDKRLLQNEVVKLQGEKNTLQEMLQGLQPVMPTQQETDRKAILETNQPMIFTKTNELKELEESHKKLKKKFKELNKFSKEFETQEIYRIANEVNRQQNIAVEKEEDKSKILFLSTYIPGGDVFTNKKNSIDELAKKLENLINNRKQFSAEIYIAEYNPIIGNKITNKLQDAINKLSRHYNVEVIEDENKGKFDLLVASLQNNNVSQDKLGELISLIVEINGKLPDNTNKKIRDGLFDDIKYYAKPIRPHYFGITASVDEDNAITIEAHDSLKNETYRNIFRKEILEQSEVRDLKITMHYPKMHENLALQRSDYECGPFSIYNLNKEYFNKLGIIYNPNNSAQFNKEIYLAMNSLYRQSQINTYYASNIFDTLGSTLLNIEFHSGLNSAIIQANKVFIQNCIYRSYDDFKYEIKKHDLEIIKIYQTKINEFLKDKEAAIDAKYNTNIVELKKVKDEYRRVLSESKESKSTDVFLQRIEETTYSESSDKLKNLKMKGEELLGEGEKIKAEFKDITEKINQVKNSAKFKSLDKKVKEGEDIVKKVKEFEKQESLQYKSSGTKPSATLGSSILGNPDATVSFR